MTNKILLVMIVTAFIVGFSTQNVFASSVDYFLKINGIPGESNDEGHKDSMDLKSFDWGASNSATSRGGGGGSGKVSVHDISFLKNVDAASPILMQSVTTGKHLKDATLELCLAGGDGQSLCYLKITLSDVLVSEYQIGGSVGDLPTDHFSLNFAKIEFEYKPQKQDGSLGEPVKATYDLKKNQKV